MCFSSKDPISGELYDDYVRKFNPFHLFGFCFPSGIKYDKQPESCMLPVSSTAVCSKLTTFEKSMLRITFLSTNRIECASAAFVRRRWGIMSVTSSGLRRTVRTFPSPERRSRTEIARRCSGQTSMCSSRKSRAAKIRIRISVGRILLSLNRVI